MSENAEAAAQEEQAPQGLEGGNYEIIRKRLVEHSNALSTKADALNEKRKETFGSSQLELQDTVRVRTRMRCLPRDIVSVDGKLLFGYNVSTGLSEIEVPHVLNAHQLQGEPGDFEVVDVEAAYLQDPNFVKAFSDMYRYNSGTRLLQLRVINGKLLAVFQIGSTVRDVRVMRWSVSPEGAVAFLDDRGERDHVFPPSHDFEWKMTSRDQHVYGDHPHINIGNEIFVECVGGDLTVKIEDNTSSGEGIYAEEVEDKYQDLAAADIYYARRGPLILLRIRPSREETWRHLIYNGLNQTVVRADAIGQACRSLPEDHGLIFPGGYYLTTGELKVFTEDVKGLEFKRSIESPNGEDVLYVFHHRIQGNYILLPYNMIRKEIQSAIPCQGYSLFEDGRMVVFRFDGDEATQIHPMQIWQTPFVSDVYAAQAPTDGSYFSKLGNAELVRGLAEFYSIARSIHAQKPTVQIYEELIAQTRRAMDNYAHWAARDEVGDIMSTLKQVLATAELIIDEFEKVLALRKQAETSMVAVEEAQAALMADLSPDYWNKVEDFIKALDRLRNQRGHIITLREVRYINLARLQELEQQVIESFDSLSRAAVEFLLRDDALKPYHDEIEGFTKQIDEVSKVTDADLLQARLEEMGAGLDLLTEVIGNLKIEDATARTQILEGISEVFALLNRTKALLTNRRKNLRSKEAVAEFGAEFKLLGQSVANALGLVDTPEKCDDQLSRLMIQLEEMESRFSEFDEFVLELATKRDEIYEAFEAKKQTLVEARQRRASNLARAAERILQGVQRRAQAFKEADALNTYFASDAMILKVRELADQLRDLGDSVKADDVEARVKSAKDQALRSLRDKQDIFEDGAAVIRLGKHRFSVNTQPLELTLLPRDDGMHLHLTGTDFFEAVQDEALLAARPFWQQALVSETDTVYRAEYLAACILFDAEAARKNLTVHKLHEATRSEGGLLALVREYAADRYDEGYDRGIHDQDAALILEKLLQLRTTGGLLRFAPRPRAMACLFWGLGAQEQQKKSWHLRARSLGRLRESFGHVHGLLALAQELSGQVEAFCQSHGLALAQEDQKAAGSYLVEELVADRPRFVSSAEAESLRKALLDHLDGANLRRAFEQDLKDLGEELAARFGLLSAWLEGLTSQGDERLQALALVIPEAASLLLLDRALDREVSSALTSGEVTGLLGQHARIADRTMALRLDEFLPRLRQFIEVRVPAYHAYRKLRQEVAERERARLRLEEFKPRVLTSFVRNQLINHVYLPIIGDNLAKQMGALGDSKRTDLMGLLLLISPPGYGKTTLMEYVANRLGLVFMKINGPALGHSVTSLDPSEAPNATARQELLKLNLGLEMGNNVMLYVDDIQHTHPEFLQKFISLCDGQRRIEGVWRDKTRTYDLRGKKFCVVMAGNPYTESGEKFQIPDMLANRADTYNLGDILDGRDDLFALSYIENTLTSNPVLAPLATRDPEDTLKLVRMAQGEEIASSELKHGYSSVEVGEIQSVLQHLFRCQKVLLRVNQEYIHSAGQDDAYRTEPPFKLQGSYRNMNKLAEKVVAVMNPGEVEALIDDHYQGEAQTLTTGAEQNLLKLAEIRGRMSEEQRQRWEEIKKGYKRIQAAGGKEEDPVARITNQLGGLNLQLENIGAALEGSGAVTEQLQGLREVMDLRGALAELRASLERSPVSAQLGGIQAALERQDAAQAMGHIARALANNQGLAQSLAGIEKSIGEAAKVAASSQDQAQMAMVSHHLRDISQHVAALSQSSQVQAQASQVQAQASQVQAQAAQVVAPPQAQAAAPQVVHVSAPVGGGASPMLQEIIQQQVEMMEWTLLPLVRTMAQDLQRGREIWNRLTEVLAFLKGVSPESLGAVEGGEGGAVFAKAVSIPSGEYEARQPGPSPRPVPRSAPVQAQAPVQAPQSQAPPRAAQPARPRQEAAPQPSQQPARQPSQQPSAPQAGSKPRISAHARARARQASDGPEEEDTAPLPEPPRVEINLPELQLGSQSVDEIGGVTLKLPAVKGPDGDN